MIISDDFIALNFPKTGSTFMREMIMNLYDQQYPLSKVKFVLKKLGLIFGPYKELVLANYHSPNPKFRQTYGQHGAFCQVPPKYLNREIISITRNPYDLYLSNFRYRWWRGHFPIPEQELMDSFPNFPVLSMDEYVDLCKRSVREHNPQQLGLLTIQFIRMYFYEPDKVLEHMTSEYLLSETMFLKDMPAITFLRNDHLNNDLADFFISKGFDEEAVRFIRSHQRINISKFDQDNDNIWTASSLQAIEESEKFLFLMLKVLGFDYPKPILHHR